MTFWTPEQAKVVIPAFLSFILFSALLGFLLRKKSERVKRIPLQIIAVFLLLIEVGKQYFSVVDGVYDTYALPFHYCSLFIYVLPVHAFYNGRHKGAVSAVSFALCSALWVFMTIMPEVVYASDRLSTYTEDFLSFHTVTFHFAVCLYFTLSFALRLVFPRWKRDIKVIAVFVSVYEVVAFILAQVLKTNFNNLYECNVEFLETARLHLVENKGIFGYAVFFVTHLIIVTLFTVISYLAVSYLYELLKKESAYTPPHSDASSSEA